jgi:hypothetical protein
MPRRKPPPRALPPFGVLQSVDRGARVVCHVCGGAYRHLGVHVTKTHHLDPCAYRARFGLRRTTSLAALEMRLRLAAVNRDHLAAVRPIRAGASRAKPIAVAARPGQPRAGHAATARDGMSPTTLIALQEERALRAAVDRLVRLSDTILSTRRTGGPPRKIAR